MNLMHPCIVGAMGLGVPELFVILVILTLIVAPIALVVWLILRRTRKDEAGSVSGAIHKK